MVGKKRLKQPTEEDLAIQVQVQAQAQDQDKDDDKKKIQRKRLEAHQVQELEAHFAGEIYPSTETKELLAQQLNLKSETVNKWFVNRRVKLRAESEKLQLKSTVGSKPPAASPEAKEKETKPKDNSRKDLIVPSDDEEAAEDEFDIQDNDQQKTAAPEKPEKLDKERYQRGMVILGADSDDEKMMETEDSFLYPTNENTNAANLPMWRQLYLQYAAQSLDAPKDKEKREIQQQKILKFIRRSREEQGLPPVFAMITGPTIYPYRMEELEVVLGRNSFNRRDADINLGARHEISHNHAIIRLNKEKEQYEIINLSKNGLSVKFGSEWLELREPGDCVGLCNPSVIKICGVLVYFQLFNVGQ